MAPHTRRSLVSATVALVPGAALLLVPIGSAGNCLILASTSTSDGTDVVPGSCSGTTSQRFRLLPV